MPGPDAATGKRSSDAPRGCDRGEAVGDETRVVAQGSPDGRDGRQRLSRKLCEGYGDQRPRGRTRSAGRENIPCRDLSLARGSTSILRRKGLEYMRLGRGSGRSAPPRL